MSNHNRPDISYDVSILSSKLRDATLNELQTVNKLINKIKDNQYKLRYLPLNAAFGNLSDGGSQAGHVIFLVDKQ